MTIDCTTPILDCLRAAYQAAPEHADTITAHATALKAGEVSPLDTMQRVGQWMASKWPAGLAHFEARFPSWAWWWGQQCTAQG